MRNAVDIVRLVYLNAVAAAKASHFRATVAGRKVISAGNHCFCSGAASLSRIGDPIV
jgi:hypothetical protein